MRRLVAALIAAAIVVPVAATATADTYTPVCLTVESGRGWYWVADQFAPGITGAAREDFIRRIWGYEEEARLTAGELVCIDPNDSALTTTATTSTTTTVPATTTSSTTVAPTTTTGPQSGALPAVPSNFTTAAYLEARPIPASTFNEPSGNFRTICRPSHYAHDDPIVNPGTASAHLHLFFGNTAIDRNSDYQSLRTEGDSTCEGGPINRTGYWMPAVLDGAGRVVPPSLIIVYYKATASGGTLDRQQAEIAATSNLPNGLRMVAGAPGGHTTWKCGDGTRQGTVIPIDCPNGYLIAIVDFPDCWDGVNLDSPNHRSHMAYRSYVNGIYTCPDTHPVHTVTITEAFHWESGATDVGTWYLSSDMGAARGSTLHADWFGAWDTPIQNRWFDNCLIGFRDSNNGNLCDGQGLNAARWAGVLPSAARVSGYTPTSTG